VSEIELAVRELACPIVGITGTNGKSTTTTLVGMALAGAGRRTFTGGNLGTPLVTALEGTYDVCVSEVSSFQLEWVTTFRPRVGCFFRVARAGRGGCYAAPWAGGRKTSRAAVGLRLSRGGAVRLSLLRSLQGVAHRCQRQRCRVGGTPSAISRAVGRSPRTSRVPFQRRPG